MSFTLLPATAAAFAPRSPPIVVLNAIVEPWLTRASKRTCRKKRLLNSFTQQCNYLTETLGSSDEIWLLCSITLPKAPNSELRTDTDLNYQMIHIEAYIIYIDMVSQNEVAFKLTHETIDLLIEYW